MLNIEAQTQQPEIFKDNSWGLRACLLVLFLLGTLIRFDELKAPGHLLDREYTSALFARAFYFAGREGVEDWRREIAITAMNQQPILEPPLLEYLVSLTYRVLGREEIFLARFWTNAFWLVGGFFLFLIARKLLSTDEAVVVTAYYLFVPMGVIISRSFQPDSMMMMLFLISLYALVLYFETFSTKHLLAAGALAGITLLLRPLVIFAIFCAFLAFSIHRSQSWKKVIDRPLVIFSFVSLLPSVLYYGYGILFAGFMRWKIFTSFMPYLLAKKEFWTGLFQTELNVAELSPVLIAMIGFFLIRHKKAQHLVIGLSAAFVLFSLAFTYHIHTHPYYHIQLFPIIGMCLAPVVVHVARVVQQSMGRAWWVPVTAAFLLAAYIGHREVRGSLYQTHLENPHVAWQIGETIHHSPRTVYVSYYYGVPLEYYGEFGGAPWPVRIEDEFYRRPGEQELSVEERIEGLGFKPEYFVITHFDLFEKKHQDLKSYLNASCTLLAQEDQYLIYDSCSSMFLSKGRQ
jgi:hypothetical protein